ncbi:helix-turn-helix domain-containing protein [Vibrio misgurnus]|uniref:helix-turn-helix domain-containing protein n=1 Tax=Vibrio misgurnus TaxID=2993714 RepID=UPI003D350707
MDNSNWDDLKFFLVLYESGKVSTAANRLNVNYATVSRRIDRLEDSLKLKLFNRTGDGFNSTILWFSFWQNTLSSKTFATGFIPVTLNTLTMPLGLSSVNNPYIYIWSNYDY